MSHRCHFRISDLSEYYYKIFYDTKILEIIEYMTAYFISSVL